MNVSVNRQDDVTKTFLDYLKTRRQKYSYCNKENGRFEGGLAFFLSSCASVLAVPLLIFITLNIMDIYLNFGISFRTFIWPLLTAISILIFWTPISGYLLDRLEKAGYGGVKGFLIFLGTGGLITCCVFLFMERPDTYYEIQQLEYIFWTMAICFPLCTAQSVKNSTYYTPSQDDRRKLLIWEFVIAFTILFIFVAIPFIVNAYINDCKCDDICVKDPHGDACHTCHQGCDNFAGHSKYFEIVLIVFVSIFGLLNFITYAAVTFRFSEDEYAPSSFNSRFNELENNGFLVLTLVITFLEYFILFTFAFWTAYYVYYQLIPENYCGLEYHYYCTRGFWIEFPIVIILLFTILIGVSFSRGSQSNIWWQWITPTIVAAGIVMISMHHTVALWYFMLVVFLGALFFTTLPNTKLMLTDGIYYDEYLSGNAQPNFGASLYIGAILLGFYFTIITMFTLINPNFTAAQAFSADPMTNSINLVNIISRFFKKYLGYWYHFHLSRCSYFHFEILLLKI